MAWPRSCSWPRSWRWCAAAAARPTSQPAADPASHGGDFTVDAYQGLGAWVDVFDFVPAYQNGGVAPTVVADDVDTMAACGVKTLYLQAARNDDRTRMAWSRPTCMVPFLERAHAEGMRVVGWYYPTFADVDVDLERLLQIARFDVGRAALRRRRPSTSRTTRWCRTPPSAAPRLVELSRRLREAARARRPPSAPPCCRRCRPR